MSLIFVSNSELKLSGMLAFQIQHLTTVKNVYIEY